MAAKKSTVTEAADTPAKQARKSTKGDWVVICKHGEDSGAPFMLRASSREELVAKAPSALDDGEYLIGQLCTEPLVVQTRATARIG